MKKIALGLLFLISACASTPDTGNMSACPASAIKSVFDG